MSILIGATLAVTGPTVIMPLLRQAKLEPRSAAFVKWEAIVNDPIGATITLLVLSFLTSSTTMSSADAALQLAWRTLLGGCIAAALILPVPSGIRARLSEDPDTARGRSWGLCGGRGNTAGDLAVRCYLVRPLKATEARQHLSSDPTAAAAAKSSSGSTEGSPSLGSDRDDLHLRRMQHKAAIRDYAVGDLDALYGIALRTGADGTDATAMFSEPKLLGLVYAAPYVTFQPELALVMEDQDGVAGYCVGALDTRNFEDLLERKWWPSLRQRFPAKFGAERCKKNLGDAELIAFIHNPPNAPKWLTERYSSHLHVNLLPRLQGQGCGLQLLRAWWARASTLGSTGFHLGVGRTNYRAARFYEQSGLTRLQPAGSNDESDAIWFGLRDALEQSAIS